MVYRIISNSFTLLAVCGSVACTNSQPQITHESEAPVFTAAAVTITDLDATANISGTCSDMGKLGAGFELYLDGQWQTKANINCLNGSFAIPVATLGKMLDFTIQKPESKSLRLRRDSVLGTSTEISVLVRYSPNIMPGKLTEGGGTSAVVSGGAMGVPLSTKYYLRGSFSGVQKEAILESVPVAGAPHGKYKMVLSRDQL